MEAAPARGYHPMSMTTATPSPAAAQRSPWHSPVPYLFGGLAAMLGLIAFALLILACSYWKLSGYLEGNGDRGDGDIEAGEAKNDEDDAMKKKKEAAFEEKILVIMAGQVKPTFLATPVSSSAGTSRSSSFGDNSNATTSSCGCNDCDNNKREGLEAEAEMVKQGTQETPHPTT
ncbi:protein GLUTAMINE DUMPER 2 [Rhodamnia argentea]|uniref:Protein GLUTAMINE DUMPER 2 n=1 Tax=Rhodamnia argentea TaxID=178133 RepID=A0A8B8PLU9_9MYRT|nr:protein GLUTAMINE DUMPER 2 [Rhodamnia argentea]